MLLGISGYARSGKDTIGQILVENHGFTQIAFADGMRECALALSPIIPLEWDESQTWCLADRLDQVVSEKGWDRAKTEYPEVRRVLQRLGTEVGRNILGENIWVVVAAQRVADLLAGGQRDFVVTDVRFPNEARWIESAELDLWPGRIIRVNRPGIGPANEHPSEVGLDDWKFHAVIDNDGTIEGLRKRVADLVAELRS